MLLKSGEFLIQWMENWLDCLVKEHVALSDIIADVRQHFQKTR